MLTTEQILKSQRLTEQCGGEFDCRRDLLVPRRPVAKTKGGGKSVKARLEFERDAETGEMRTVRR